jgi:translation elongation factor EF-4
MTCGGFYRRVCCVGWQAVGRNMRQCGKVEIPQQAFINALKMDG